MDPKKKKKRDDKDVPEEKTKDTPSTIDGLQGDDERATKRPKNDPTTTSTSRAAAAATKGTPKLVVCRDCGVEKDRNTIEFSKNQLKKGAAAACCRACIEARSTASIQKNKPQPQSTKKKKCETIAAAAVPSSEKEVVAAAKDESGDNNAWVSPLPGPGRTAMMEALKKLAAQESEVTVGPRAYWRTFGVGYEAPKELDYLYPDCYGETPDSASSSLVGNYNIVYYHSDRSCCDEDQTESIARTARGWAHLTMENWQGTPALFGGYQIDCQPSFGGGTLCRGLSDTISGTFVENSVGWDPQGKGYNGFNIHGYDSNSNAMKLVFDRGIDTRREPLEWWQDLGTDNEQSSDENMNAFCGGILNVMNKRVALGLCPDWLAGNPYNPRACPNHELLELEDPDNLKRAEELMDQYCDRSSWVTTHLGLPKKVAFCIREFVTPPPVFYLEKGDLIVRIEESREPEWDKTLVLRKMTQEEETKHLAK